ncbi:MAG: hypothetical protein KDA78_17065, partial [Planctomycetaceae bacterium]|nr:hypothetical protein [Planctomycetaceae bacterium]
MITSENIDQLVQPDPGGIPLLLRKRRQWVCWKLQADSKNPGAFTKVPVNPATGGLASSTNPATWSDFDTAWACCQSKQATGIGFVTVVDDGLVLVDLDNCRDPKTGELTEFASHWVQAFATYTEVSPSGTGLHLIVLGAKPTSRCRNKALGIECYAQGRFFCITGVSPAGPTADVRKCQPVLEQFFAECLVEDQAEPEQQSPSLVVPLPSGIDEERILQKIQRSKNAIAIIALLQGNREAYHGDHSAADQALCNHLAFWCDRDTVLIDQIFRKSGLMRDKWDERHAGDGRTYGEMTIQQALERCQSTYGWADRNSKQRRKDSRPENRSEPQILSNEQDALRDIGPPGPYVDLEREECFWAEDATDRRNAELLMELHGQDIVYCAPWKSWLIWDGTRWKKDETLQIFLKAYSVGDYWFRKLSRISDKEMQKYCLSHAQRASNTRGIEAFLKQAQSQAGITPDWLNRDPWLFNCPNGTIELRTSRLRAHCRSDFITTLCPTAFNPEAESLVWDQFLESVFADHGDLIPYLQRLFGYGLIGKVEEHVLPILWGNGANGKTTLLNAIINTLGSDYAMQATSDMLMDSDRAEHKTEQADLFGKRFVSAVETESSSKLKEALVKQLTGGDKIRARFLYKDFFEFEPSHLITLTTNHKPKVLNEDDGIWRRLQLIPFVQSFLGAKADSKLPDRLKQQSEGIL